MSNKFLNPSGDTDLSDVIARVNSNTEAIQDHVGDLTNPHDTSTNNIQGNNSPPLNSDDVVEGATNKYLVQPFNTQFDMGGNDIINVSTIGNNGQIALANTTSPPGTGSVLVLDPTAAPTIGPVLQSGAGKDINILSDADCDIKNVNAGYNIRLFGDIIELKNQAETSYLTLDTTEITSFKDMNMNNNIITNVNEVNSTSTLLLGNSANNDGVAINSNVTTGVTAFADTGKKVALIADGGNNIVNIQPTQTEFINNIDMNNNDIINVTRIEGNTGQDMVLYSDDGITVAARDPMIINALDGDGIICQTSSNTRMVITSTEVDVREPINMNNNNIDNVNRITGNGCVLDFDGSNALVLSGIGSFLSTGNATFGSTNGNVSFRTTGLNPAVLLSTGGNAIFYNGINLQSGDITDVGSINGLSPIGGNLSGTSNSALLTASTTETSIMPLTFVGSKQVPADTFQQGDCFSATLAGSFGSANGDDLTIRLKGGATGTTLLSSEVVPLSASSASSFELKIEFSVRQTGAAGVAELVTNYVFTYNQSGGGGAFVGERNCEINTTTFDTTILNQLDITAEFSSANASNSIQTFLSNLHKIY